MLCLGDALYPLLEADQTILSPIKGPISGSGVMIPSADPLLLDVMEVKGATCLNRFVPWIFPIT